MTSTREVNELARALVEVADGEGVLIDVLRDVQQVVDVFKTERGLLADLHQPVTPLADRRNALKKGLSDLCHPFVIHTLLVMQQAHLLNQVELLGSSVIAMAKQMTGHRSATVTSAIPLTHKELAELERFMKGTKKELTLETRVDPTILGGVIIEMDGTRIDASVAGACQQLRQSLRTT